MVHLRILLKYIRSIETRTARPTRASLYICPSASTVRSTAPQSPETSLLYPSDQAGSQPRYKISQSSK